MAAAMAAVQMAELYQKVAPDCPQRQPPFQSARRTGSPKSTAVVTIAAATAEVTRDAGIALVLTGAARKAVAAPDHLSHRTPAASHRATRLPASCPFGPRGRQCLPPSRRAVVRAAGSGAATGGTPGVSARVSRRPPCTTRRRPPTCPLAGLGRPPCPQPRSRARSAHPGIVQRIRPLRSWSRSRRPSPRPRAESAPRVPPHVGSPPPPPRRPRPGRSPPRSPPPPPPRRAAGSPARPPAADLSAAPESAGSAAAAVVPLTVPPGRLDHYRQCAPPREHYSYSYGKRLQGL